MFATMIAFYFVYPTIKYASKHFTLYQHKRIDKLAIIFFFFVARKAVASILLTILTH